MSPVELVGPEYRCWTAEYLLAHCESYRVESADGKVGYVEEVVWSPGNMWSPPVQRPGRAARTVPPRTTTSRRDKFTRSLNPTVW
jgi:hypothetical protein